MGGIIRAGVRRARCLEKNESAEECPFPSSPCGGFAPPESQALPSKKSKGRNQRRKSRRRAQSKKTGGISKAKRPLFVTIPHSGVKIPPQANWLKSLSDSVLFCDVDAFVDELYQPALEEFQIPSLVFPWHRCAADANRFPEDVSPAVVEGAKPSSSASPSFIHWRETTRGDLLLPKPISKETHQALMDLCYNPFHKKIRERFADFKQRGFCEILLLDLHSMPSVGRDFHKDPGQKRAEAVLGDCEGRSASGFFRALAGEAFQRAGFETVWNWPYKGGGIAQTYGRPEEGMSVIQVELSRALYMDEETKGKSKDFRKIQGKLRKALAFIARGADIGQAGKSAGGKSARGKSECGNVYEKTRGQTL